MSAPLWAPWAGFSPDGAWGTGVRRRARLSRRAGAVSGDNHGRGMSGSGVRKVGVVGLGTMGAGIAQVCVQAGIETVGREVSEELCERARERIAHYLGRGVEKGRLTAAERDASARSPDDHDRARRPGRLRPRDRGDRRGARRQAGALPRARGRRGGARRPGDQHLGALGDRGRDGDCSPGASRRHALLQPGAGAPAGRGRADRALARRAPSTRPSSWPSGSARSRSAATTRRASSSTASSSRC